MSSKFKVSVVLPTFNEIKTGFAKTIGLGLKDYQQIQKIAVDFNSTDGTPEHLKDFGFEVLNSDLNTRAGRLNQGIDKALSEIVVLHHPRSVIPKEGWEYLVSGGFDNGWGGFTHSFDVNHRLLKFTSWYSNHVRRRLSGVLYLDHCFVISKDVLNQLPKPPIPDVDIFEDTELSIRLSKVSKPKLIPIKVTTSAIRFSKNGLWKQSLMNQSLKAAYHLGIDPKKMNSLYEKGLSLNSKYEK